MVELLSIIALLLLAFAVRTFVHHRRKAKMREWHHQFDSYEARRNHAKASTIRHPESKPWRESTRYRRDDPMADPLHPLNPIGLVNPIIPISPFNPSNSFSSQSDDTPARTYSCDSSSSWSSSDSGSSSSDSGSSYSSCD